MNKNNGKITAISLALACALIVPSGCGPIKSGEGSRSDYASRLLAKYRIDPGETDFYGKVRVRSNLARSHYRLGIFYLRQGQYSDAATAFSKAIKTDPNNIKAYNGLAVSYDGMGMYKAAQRVYGAALARHPDEAYLHNNIGCSHLLQDDPAKALASFTRARQLDRENNRIRNNRALVLAKSKMNNKPTGPVIFEAETGRPSAKKALAAGPPQKKVRQEGVSCLEERKAFRVEVANGNGIRGMAGRSAAYFRKKGITVKHVTNAEHFKFQQSLIVYKEGFLREAYLVAAMIPGFQEMKKIPADARQRVDVKVILGRDTAQTGFLDMIGAKVQKGGLVHKVSLLCRKISSRVGLA